MRILFFTGDVLDNCSVLGTSTLYMDYVVNTFFQAFIAHRENLPC